MTVESEMMCWFMLILVVWAVMCCIWEDLENRNPLDEYHSSFEYQRTLAAENLEEE